MAKGGRRFGAGRPRLPDSEKAARGTLAGDKAKEAWYAKKKAAEREKLATTASRLELVAVGEPPADLSAAEAQWWRVLGAQVDTLGIFTAADFSSFRLLAVSYALLERARKDKKTSVASIVALARSVGAHLQRFGLDPNARDKLVRISSVPEKRDDPDDFRPMTLKVVPP